MCAPKTQASVGAQECFPMTSLGISVEDRDGVRHVVLDRPHKKNALTAAMYAALGNAIASAQDDDVGAILLQARGDIFTAGNDLRDFLEHRRMARTRRSFGSCSGSCERTCG